MTPLLRRFALLFLVAPLPGCIFNRDQGTEMVSETAGKKSAPRQAIGKALALMTQEVPAGLDALKAADKDLAHAEGAAGAVEKDAIAALRQFFGKLIGAGGAYEAASTGAVTPKDLRALDGTIEVLASLYPEDFDMQLAAVNVLLHRDQPADAVKSAEQLVQRFPTEPRAQSFFGRALSTQGRDPVAAMRAYAACLKLAPRMEACRAGLVELSGDFARLRCALVPKGRFSVHREIVGKPKAKLGTTKVDGETVRYSLVPELTGADVAEVAEEPDLSSVGLMPGDGKSRDFQLSLTPAGAGKFEALTRELADWKGHVVVLVSGKVVTAPQVMTAMESGTMRLSAPIELSAFCDKLEKRTLPTELEDAVNRAIRP